METSPTSLDPRTLAKLHGLTLRARQIVEGYVAGLHRSPYRGFSIEFAEHREYVPGDDLRYVDWKAFARTDKFYLKQHEDETNLIVYLLLDVSESMTYRGPGSGLSKLEYAQSLSAALAWLVLQQQDAVGLATFDQQVRACVRPASTPAHLQPLLQAIERTTPTAKTALGPIFHDLAGRFTKRGLVVILSDLFDGVDSMLAGLRHLRRRRHDVLLLHVLDPAEIEFPFEDGTLFQGLEQYADLQADPAAVRAEYLVEFEKFLQRVKSGVRSAGVDYHLLRTDSPFDVALAGVLSARRTRAG